MLSYQHAYHAGNFADVHKHLALYALVRALQRKESAISFIDTHAGRGIYSLTDRAATKTGEFQAGIGRLWPAADLVKTDSLLTEWLETIAAMQSGRALRCYPGSPWWLGRLRRRQDRLTLFELHPAEYDALVARKLSGVVGQSVRKADGLAAVADILPVRTPRVCLVIDPSYEIKHDYRAVAKTLRQVVQKARHAVVLLWYPVLAAGRHRQMLDALCSAELPKLWHSELSAPSAAGMQGSGVLLLNPPWQLDSQLTSAFDRLARQLDAAGGHKSRWLSDK